MEPFGLIGSGGSPELKKSARKHLQVIRPCRESKTGWTPEARKRPGNQNSLELNEHGPALKVFWISENRDWARDQCGCGLPARGCGCRKQRTNKTEPEGARTGITHSGPLLSVRNQSWETLDSTKR